MAIENKELTGPIFAILAIVGLPREAGVRDMAKMGAPKARHLKSQ